MDAESNPAEPVAEGAIFAGITAFLESTPLRSLPLDDPRFRGEQDRTRDLTADELHRLRPLYDRYGLPPADAVRISAGSIAPDADAQDTVYPTREYANITFIRGIQTTDYMFTLEETVLTGVKEVAEEPGLRESQSSFPDPDEAWARLSSAIIETVTTDPNDPIPHAPSTAYGTYPISSAERAFLQEVLGVLGGEPTPPAVTA